MYAIRVAQTHNIHRHQCSGDRETTVLFDEIVFVLQVVTCCECSPPATTYTNYKLIMMGKRRFLTDSKELTVFTMCVNVCEIVLNYK